MQSEETSFIILRKECIDKSLQSFGYGHIFDRRTIKYSKRVNWLKIFGILVPALIGLTAIGYGFSNFLVKLIWVSGIVTMIQFTFSVFAIIFKWDEELSYSFEASQSYSSLWDRFKKLAQTPPDNYEGLNKEYDLLNTEYRLRGQQDTKHDIKEKERRIGMRYALREFQRECAACKKIPVSMDATDCPVCGNF